MPDMIVPLNSLPAVSPLRESLRQRGIEVRRPNPWEQEVLRRFILQHFSQGWADETSLAFARQPITAFIAERLTTEEKGPREIIGFAAYECTRKCYFGPTGVSEPARGLGVGTLLLFASLHGLRELGYVYGIIGDAGPTAFYEKTVSAVALPFPKEIGAHRVGSDPIIDALR